MASNRHLDLWKGVTLFFIMKLSLPCFQKKKGGKVDRKISTRRENITGNP